MITVPGATGRGAAAAALLDSPPVGPGRPEAIPHVVAWNLTRRCNLACAHCYISAGSWHATGSDLTAAECRRITDEIVAFNPAPLFILSGGEPLLRPDLERIAGYAASAGATVVVGTNGTLLTAERIRSLQQAGVQGVAVSVDSLRPAYHDRFRHGDGALADTLAAVERLRALGLDFIVQTTVTRGNRDELQRLAEWAADAGAVAFNVYFLVTVGRGAGMRGLDPAENEAVLEELVDLQRRYLGRMLVRSKCQPQIMRIALRDDPDSPLLNYATRCPCGVQYCRITPEGKLTPCPYMPLEAGDLRQTDFATVWLSSALLRRLREGELGGRCGSCEYRRVCGGCRARAYAETGDVLAADDACAYQPSGALEPIEPRARITYGAPARSELAWSAEARARVERVPSFVRAVVMARVERFARERGETEVTPALLDEVRRVMPVDFSKRSPFFLRHDA